MKVFILLAVIAVASGSPAPRSLDCSGLPDGDYPNAADCTTFYSCSNGDTYLKDCALIDATNKLHFDEPTLRCQWPELARCAGDDCKRGKAGGLDGVAGCHGHENDDKYPDPYDCNSFYYCEWADQLGNVQARHKQCPSVLHFSDTSKSCELPEEADCKRCGGDPEPEPTYAPTTTREPRPTHAPTTHAPTTTKKPNPTWPTFPTKWTFPTFPTKWSTLPTRSTTVKPTTVKLTTTTTEAPEPTTHAPTTTKKPNPTWPTFPTKWTFPTFPTFPTKWPTLPTRSTTVKPTTVKPTTTTTEAPEPTVNFFRYWSISTGDHFYSTNWEEIAGGQYPEYEYEGIQCKIFANPAPGTSPLFRYRNTPIVDHFYTLDISELGEHGGEYHVNEGIAGYIYSAEHEGTVPLFRYYNQGIVDHFYTTTWNELGDADKGWVYEGVAGFVFPA